MAIVLRFLLWCCVLSRGRSSQSLDLALEVVTWCCQTHVIRQVVSMCESAGKWIGARHLAVSTVNHVETVACKSTQRISSTADVCVIRLTISVCCIAYTGDSTTHSLCLPQLYQPKWLVRFESSTNSEEYVATTTLKAAYFTRGGYSNKLKLENLQNNGSENRNTQKIFLRTVFVCSKYYLNLSEFQQISGLETTL